MRIFEAILSGVLGALQLAATILGSIIGLPLYLIFATVSVVRSYIKAGWEDGSST